MDELSHRSASECLAALRTREVSSLELVDACIARIEALNPELNAVVATDYDRARETARVADAARANGNTLGLLHGLPMTIKDSLETAGLVTTSGAPELRDYVPQEDAVAVHRAIEAGAIILGKTNLPIYAGDWQTYNTVYGRTNNPWNLARTVGGSSGGAAAAIAAGFVPLEIGSDIGGSIRTPAHYCGVYGHKPSYGIVPGRGHIPGPPGTKSEADLAVVGPLARTAGDLQLALDVIAGPDTLMRDGWSLNLPASRADRLSEFRVGYWLDDPLCPIDATVRDELEATIEALRPHVELVDIGAAASTRTSRVVVRSIAAGGHRGRHAAAAPCDGAHSVALLRARRPPRDLDRPRYEECRARGAAVPRGLEPSERRAHEAALAMPRALPRHRRPADADRPGHGVSTSDRRQPSVEKAHGQRKEAPLHGSRVLGGARQRRVLASNQRACRGHARWPPGQRPDRGSISGGQDDDPICRAAGGSARGIPASTRSSLTLALTLALALALALA